MICIHIRTLLAVVALSALVACVGDAPCESVFDCPVGEACLADGTCGVVQPEPEPGPEPFDAGFDAGSLDAGIDAGPLDAGFDAGPFDAGIDAGPLDAGPLDAGFDAGPVDAGPLDAGVDAGPVDGGFDAGPVDAGPPAVRAVAAGGFHTCAILQDGSVRCWGRNLSGELGVGDTENRGDDETAFPTVNLGAGRTAVSIAASGHTCVILDDGSVKCWGRNANGQLGVGDTENRGDNETDFPTVNLGAGRTAISVATGSIHTCALLDNGMVKCWGQNFDGQLGLGDTEDRGDDETDFTAVSLGAGRTAMTIAAGASHTCVVLDDGSVKCWGQNMFGQLGLGDVENRGDNETDFATVNLGAGRTAVAVTAGNIQTCALLDDSSVKCWGYNVYGELGLGDTESRGDDETDFTAVDLGEGRTAVSVQAGGVHTCVLLDDGRAMCWGSNSQGQLGRGDTENRGDDETDFVPVDLGAGRSALSIASSGAHTCAIFHEGVKCWGMNQYGRLGLGDELSRGDNAGEMGDSLPFVLLP